MQERAGLPMSSLFISHSSRDQNIATRLVDRLRSVGFASLFVDFDPECGIATGRDWERKLHTQLRQADGVIFLGSPASNQSRWCFAELALARSIGKPIFPILIGNIERHPLLNRGEAGSPPAEDAGAHSAGGNPPPSHYP